VQQLQQMIAIPATAPGANAVAQVTLNILQSRSVTPDLLAFDNGSFDFVSLVGTTLTVINKGAVAGTTNVWLYYFHSTDRSYGAASITALSPAPFVIRGAGGSGSAGLWGYPTSAALLAQPGPTPAQSQFAYVAEFDATYAWAPGSVTAADTFRVIGHTGGVAGRWILVGGNITLAPSRGATWATLIAARTAMAYHGSITCEAEAWTADVGVALVTNLPNGTHEIWETGATINGTIAFSPGTIAQNAIWYNNGGTTAPTAATTLAVNATFAATSLELTNAAGFNVNGWFRIQEGVAYTRTYRILAKAGDVITIDRPLRRPFTAGATCEALIACRDITIEGNGVVVTGQADALIQIASGVNCHFLDINATWTGKGFGACFDLGSRDCTMNNVFVDCQGLTQQCFLIANTENIDLYDCIGIRAGVAGAPTGVVLAVPSSDDFHCWGGSFTESDGSVCILDVEDATDPYGTRGSTFSDVYFGNAAGSGVLVQNGSSFNTWVGCEFSYNQSGIGFANGLTAPNENTVQGGVARGNTQGHVFAAMGTNKIIGLSCSEGPVNVVVVNNNAVLECIGVQNMDTSGAAAAGSMFIVTGAVLIASGCIANTNRAAHHMFETGAAGRLVIAGGCRFTGTAANCAGLLMNAASVARVDNFTVVSAAGGFGIFLNNAAAFCRLGSNVDVAGATTPYNIAAGAFNRSLVPVALNGAVPVPLAFGDTNAQDRCFTTLVAAGGVPTGQIFTGAPVVGTGFNVVGVAGDTSTFHYEIR
jgi:hypothetical protein